MGYTQTLDNLDGKQARRTGSSSPLGLLFDHGCDAFNTTLGAVNQACTMQCGATWKALAVWQLVALPFFFTTLEELYTGELVLPVRAYPPPVSPLLSASCSQRWRLLTPVWCPCSGVGDGGSWLEPGGQVRLNE